MNKTEFLKIRHYFGKSQLQISQLLGVSLKAVQSFEQGWRRIPVHIERQLLFLLALKQDTNKKGKPCWALQKCPKEVRDNCPTWEFKAGHYCWCICGTICHGKVQESWQKKMKICRRCEIFQKIIFS
jgi:DNA-binding XRE family transcriptional regulator